MLLKGTTNDGNTARRAFRNYKKFAEITEIDETLIWRIHSILCLVNSTHHKIDVEKFKKYCDETYDLYVSLYSWFYMPVSMHKLLIHSSQVIQKLELPIVMYSEEALESRNKDHKKIRENHTRKCNRQLTMTDLFCRKNNLQIEFKK